MIGEKLTEDYVKTTRKTPPAVFGFDGKIMITNVYEEDDHGDRHPKTSKIDQIGNIALFVIPTFCLWSPSRYLTLS